MVAHYEATLQRFSRACAPDRAQPFTNQGANGDADMKSETTFTQLETAELEQIQGGWQATLLYAMGWKSYTQLYMDKNGMTYTKTFWVPPKPL